MSHIRFSGIFVVFCFGSFFLLISYSTGQDVPATATPVAESTPDHEPAEPLEIKLSVNEVRLDVVVLDKKGNPITDLTAADFEVYQDKKRQEILSSVYIDNQPHATAQSAAGRKNAPNSGLPLTPSPLLKKEDVSRTIIFLVDDYAMWVDNGYYAKMALRNFVEKQMQPGDLVAIIRTDYGNRALNMFHTDKREALARINALPTTMVRSPVEDIAGFSSVGTPGMSAAVFEMQKEFNARVFKNLVSNLSYSINTLKNMPGRKIINTVTKTLKYYSEDEPILLKLSDEALRAGVVINFLGIDGLKNFAENGADASFSKNSNGYFLLAVYEQQERLRPLNPLPDLTGGVTIYDSNFFLTGIGREIESLMKGYYLISYEPPADTFEKRNKIDNLYRRLKVNVKRKGAVVHTRDGFFGTLESKPDDDTPKNPLIEAIYSPFKQDDINVNIAAGYVKNADAGYLVRSWIHLDAEDLKIVETEDGNGWIGLEAVCLTTDINGNVDYARNVEFTLPNINMEWIKKHGLRFSMLLPVKKPGPYYIRISIRDTESGKVGSAYQFLEIPDLEKKGLALSNIFTLTSADDLQWMNSKETTEGLFFPVFQNEEIRSPALRTYSSGDSLLTMIALYNADEKAIARSEIETQTIVYKDGVELRRTDPMPVTTNGEGSPDGILILQRFTVGSDMPPGNYVRQLVVTDKKNSKKNEGVASQTMSFTITEK